jgi:hypothetical protein
MHAERLYSIIQKISHSFGEAQIGVEFDKLINSVNNRISNPADRQLDEQISSEVKFLFAALDNSEMREFPATWRKSIQDLDLGILLPENIRAAVETALSNRIVDSDLLKSLETLRTKIFEKLGALDQLQSGFRAIGFKDDELQPREVEFDVMMPRESINDQLNGFNKELGHLNRELQVLSAIAKNPGNLFKINSISTNDFSLALNINIDLGQILITVLLGLVVIQNGYRSKADIIGKNLSDLPENLLSGFRDWVNQYVKTEIGTLIDRLPTECPDAVDTEKLLAIKMQVQGALEYLAEKQEKGFNMDVRTGAPPEIPNEVEAETAELKKIQRESRRLREITRKSAEMKVLERQSTPILNLTKPDGAEEN